MNARPRPIAPEVARRAEHLPECPPCAVPPMLVAVGGKVYVHCPRCNAQTHRCRTAHAAETQWKCLAATAEPQES